MSAIGPALPPHLLAKRKRQQAEADEDAPATDSGAKRPSSTDSSSADKRRRVMGPAMPPAPLDQKPLQPANQAKRDSDDDSSDDGDFGPALPSNSTGETEFTTTAPDYYNRDDDGHTSRQPETTGPQRDEWMTMPPTQDDLAARLDPSKPRAKAFNTGKSARGGGGGGGGSGDGSTWHETAEQKQKRLADEMMGIVKKPAAGPAEKDRSRSEVEDAAARRQRGQRGEQTEQLRGPSLLEQHQHRKGGESLGDDDDPSQRAFDREKDMGSGGRISSSQRRQLLSKASDYGSKFAKGGML